jgi:hypothetical protein
MTTTATTYADAVREIAEDVIRQMIDGEAPDRQHNYQAANGDHYPSARVFFADITANHEHGIPAGVARVSLDLAGWRWPTHEVRVFLQPVPMPIAARACAKFADDIAAAVLDMIDNTADYAS